MNSSSTFSSKPDQVLVVPPMALAWLTESESATTVVSFEARGHSDATVLLSSHRSAGRQQPRPGGRAGGFAVRNYTVIIGSHRNSCVKIEKNGVVVCQVQTRGGQGYGASPSPSPSPAGSAASSPIKGALNASLLHPMQLDPHVFRTFWVSYGHGEIRIGHGAGFGDEQGAFCAWKDVEAGVEAGVGAGIEAGVEAGVEGATEGDTKAPVRQVGLSAWNTHVGYGNVHVKTGGRDDDKGVTSMGESEDPAQMSVSVHRALEFLEYDDVDMDEGDRGDACSTQATVMSLLETCIDTIKHTVTVETVCAYLVGLDRLTNQQHLSSSSDVFLRTREHCVAFAATHIESLFANHREQLCGLPSSMMEAIVKHQAVPCSEIVVYAVVRCWYCANGPDALDADPFKLMRHVRFPLMSGNELASLAGTHGDKDDRDDRDDRVGRDDDAGDAGLALPGWQAALDRLVQEATDFHRECKNTLHDPSIFIDGVLDDGKMLRLPTDVDGPLRFRERSPSGCCSLVYMYDGDNNGVFQFLGSRYGTAPWSNPVAAGLVSITSSSPLGRFCDPRAIVGRSFSSLNFAGPRRSADGQTESWWAVDLQHGLRCTRYAVRHDGSADYLRSWVFQGSTDGTSWIVLDEHTGDATIRMPAQWASWPVRDARRRTFRYFRILQTAPNTGAPNPMHLSLDHLELYGDLVLQPQHMEY